VAAGIGRQGWRRQAGGSGREGELERDEETLSSNTNCWPKWIFINSLRGPKGSLDTYIDSKEHILGNMLLDP
jgi:hypothetical protein